MPYHVGMPCTPHHSKKAIALACAHVGGQAALARALGGLTAPTIHQWVDGKRPVPESQCPKIEVLTEGVFTCESLRPDVAWRRVPDADWPWHPEGKPLIDLMPEVSTQEVGEVGHG